MLGIVPSLNTTFSSKGDLDLSSLSDLVDRTKKAACRGMLRLAVAGEHHKLNLQEKIKIIETVVIKNNGRFPFIYSVTSSSFSERFKFTKIARSAGANGFLCNYRKI